jgi:hypothetical protein
VILGDISFKQVVASEKAVDSDRSQVSVFAVSTAGELYFIEGTRAKRGVVPTFKTTGIPIRRDIGFLSTQYNPDADASEVVYVSTNSSRVKHMLRDQKSSMWTEQAIHVKWDKDMTTYVPLIFSIIARAG